MSKPSTPNPNKDSLTLNNGAMRLLPSVINDCSLTQPLHIVAIGTLQEQSFLDLPKFPELKANERLSAIEEMKQWQRKGAHKVPVTPSQREALRELFKSAIERGLIPAGPASLCWLRELGMSTAGG